MKITVTYEAQVPDDVSIDDFNMDGVLNNHFLTILKDNLCTVPVSTHVKACSIHNLDVLAVNPFFASVSTDNVNCSVHSSLYLIRSIR